MIFNTDILQYGLPWWLNIKASAYNAGDAGFTPGSGRPLGGGNGNLLQYVCLENSMDSEAWQAVVHRIAESDMTEHIYLHTYIAIYLNILYIQHSQLKR